MLFNSYSFLLFFLAVLALDRVLPSWTARKSMLLAGSYLFYAAWNPPFVLLLVFSTVLDWFLARAIHRAPTPGRRRAMMVVSLAVNLGMLGLFKYGVFAVANAEAFMRLLGWEGALPRPSLILPVGISFYTFQTLSYTLDVYRRVMKPWTSFLDYALYVTFFPQLVAGPIVRATDFLPQCATPKRASRAQFIWGLYLMTIGLFNKVVVADTLMSPAVEAVYGTSGAVGFVEAWTGTLAFSIQIFCDFAGYSTCAIGAALCLGFVLPDNFRFPYAALGFSDFWKRWHISLSTWLRDYLYIPLGGNRRGAVRTNVNLMLTMLIGGLWHGASWMFVVWGGLHGLYLVAERAVRAAPLAAWRVWQRPAGRLMLILLTYALVCLTWVFFRATSMENAWAMLRAMLGGSGWSVEGRLDPRHPLIVVGVAAATLLVQGWQRDRSLEDTLGRWPAWCRAGVVALLAFVVILAMQAEDRAFIYFQF